MAKAHEYWTCPKCGRKLYVRNQEHTCNLAELESHFTNRDPIGRRAFEWMCDTLDELGGEYDVLPTKTIIAFAKPSNIAFLKTKKNSAEISVVLQRPLASKRISGQTVYSSKKTIYRITIKDAKELDDELKTWLREAAGA